MVGSNNKLNNALATIRALASYKHADYFSSLKIKTAEEVEANEDGYIYIHDQDFRLDSMNCCLFDISSVLSGGFEMANMWYNEPTTLSSAFDVIGDIVLSAAPQQYGGFTLPEIDKVLSPYAEKSFNKYLKLFIEECNMEEDAAEELPEEYGREGITLFKAVQHEYARIKDTGKERGEIAEPPAGGQAFKEKAEDAGKYDQDGDYAGAAGLFAKEKICSPIADFPVPLRPRIINISLFNWLMTSK